LFVRFSFSRKNHSRKSQYYAVVPAFKPTSGPENFELIHKEWTY